MDDKIHFKKNALENAPRNASSADEYDTFINPLLYASNLDAFDEMVTTTEGAMPPWLHDFLFKAKTAGERPIDRLRGTHNLMDASVSVITRKGADTHECKVARTNYGLISRINVADQSLMVSWGVSVCPSFRLHVSWHLHARMSDGRICGTGLQ
jgi:hypothetical protein